MEIPTLLPGFELIKEDPNYSINRNGIILNKMNIPLTPNSSTNIVGINQRPRTVGRMVAVQFVPNPNNLPYAMPIDGNKFNVDYRNWKWSGANGIRAIQNTRDYVEKMFNTVMKYRYMEPEKIQEKFDINRYQAGRIQMAIAHMEQYGLKLCPDTFISDFTPLICDGVTNDEYSINIFGVIQNNLTFGYLLGSPDIDGYFLVNLSTTSTVKPKVHRLVSETFIPNPEDKPQVNHKNGCKFDPCVWNLEWVTNRENGQDAYDIGLREKVYSDDIIQCICKDLYSGRYNSSEVAKKNGVPKYIVTNVKYANSRMNIIGQFYDTIAIYNHGVFDQKLTNEVKNKVVKYCVA